MSDQLYRLVEDDPEFGIYRKAIENRDGTLPDGVLVWYGHDNYLQGFLVPVTKEPMTRAEWEASIESVVTVNPNSDNTFGWMEHVKGPPIETTETMLGSGRYGLVKLNVEEDS